MLNVKLYSHPGQEQVTHSLTCASKGSGGVRFWAAIFRLCFSLEGKLPQSRSSIHADWEADVQLVCWILLGPWWVVAGDISACVVPLPVAEQTGFLVGKA